MAKFDSSEALRFGWQSTTAHWAFWIPALLVFLGVGALGALTKFLSGGTRIAYLVLHFAADNLVIFGLIRSGIKLADDEPPDLFDLAAGLPGLLNYIVGMVIYWAIVTVGTILLIVPGAIWAMKYLFIPWFIADEGMNPFEAMQASADITDGAKWDLTVFTFVLLLINLAGMIPLGLGLFVTVPVTLSALGAVYRMLRESTGTVVREVVY